MKIRWFNFVLTARAKTGAASVFLALAGLSPAAVVTTVADSGPGSLRQVLLNATPGEVITFAPALSGQTLILSNGQLSVTKNLTLDASGLPAGFRIDGRRASRVFTISQNMIATFDSLTVTRGGAGFGAGGAISVGSGATLTLTQCSVTDSSAGSNGGGGVFVDLGGKLMLNGCTIAGNSVSDGSIGGGIFMHGGSTLLATNSTISGNSARTAAGGVYSQSGTITLLHSTVTGNMAGNRGGGIHLNGDFVVLTLTNTIVAGNSASNASNIFGVFSGSNNLTDGDPFLAPLGNYGGPTPTRPPLPGSPALDAGVNVGLTVDQRGFVRPLGTAPDIGAVEGAAVLLADASLLANGRFQFRFTNAPGAMFSVLASTNLTSPSNEWLDLGLATDNPAGSGEFEFTEPQPAEGAQRFFRVRVN